MSHGTGSAPSGKGIDKPVCVTAASCSVTLVVLAVLRSGAAAWLKIGMCSMTSGMTVVARSGLAGGLHLLSKKPLRKPFGEAVRCDFICLFGVPCDIGDADSLSLSSAVPAIYTGRQVSSLGVRGERFQVTSCSRAP